MQRFLLAALASLFCFGQALADQPVQEPIPADVVSTHPEVQVESVDYESLRVRRIDVVDAEGIIRMTLAGDLPNPVIDGVEWRRSTPVGGLVLRDDHGNERGGFGFASKFGAVVFALDHNNGEAAGFNTLPDGSANMMLISRPAQARNASLGDHLVPGPTTTPIQMSVTPEGAPVLMLNDAEDRPRMRLKVSEEGYGVIEFLDAEGNIVDQLAPERDQHDRAH
ncbi:MAG: hypothetical protein FP825_05075 [Hyphomonas sp.]|uniref:hypothetical protein n=1 Tax=Hyphomonas sp. TaxID=87 RepID=UPI001832A1BF|nr:hypothetical protein [Hyphomonas sp.]MBA3067839.1 hypothetical protein [Hyphomonas sp.]MBU4062395.1 hypothetical protein [Alphaproteobacteria bacterium]MBU4165997.1 hypothetical protein [Alphaproteobacteria bacterium]